MPPSIRRIDSARLVTTLVLSGLGGFAVGVHFATWQWAVELAQFAGGLVPTTAGSPAAAVQAHLWSLIDQSLAFALKAGVSEQALSCAVSGLMGMLSCQALALVVLGLTDSVWVATLTPALSFVTGSFMHGVSYPVMLLGTPHTYGAVGLAFSVLAAVIAMAGYWTAGGVLLGIAVSVQITTGAPVLLCTLVVLIATRLDRPSQWLWTKGLVAGLSVSALSYMLFLITRPGVAGVDAATARRYLIAFASEWDAHRLPVPLLHHGVVINVVLLIVCGTWIWRLPQALTTPGMRRLLLFGFVSAIAGLMSGGIASLPLAWLPSAVIAAMPGRLLNIGALVAAPTLIGVLASRPARLRVGWWGVAGFATALLASGPSSLALAITTGSRWNGLSQTAVCFAAGLVAVGIALTTPAHGSLDARDLSRVRLSWPLAGLVAVIVTALAIVGAPVSVKQEPTRLQTALDPVLTAAATRSGVLLTAGNLWLVQLRTRRPVLLDGGSLDTLPYASESGPRIAEILRGAYGIDLFNPPALARHRGQIPGIAHRALWEGWSRAQWADIRARYGVEDVLTFDEWTLRLPLVASSSELKLYALPSN
jgi:hypothetical protein